VNDRTDAIRRSYDTVADEYVRRIAGELANKPLDRALLDAFAELVGDRGTVADIGCGPGHVGRYLGDRGVSVLGVDLSTEMVRVARTLNPGMEFRQGSMLALDVPDGSLAGIVAFYSIIHIAPPELPRVFAEFHRVLAPNGLALLAFHLGTEPIHRDEWWGHTVDVDTHLLQREAVERLLAEAGFSVEAHLEREPNPAVEHPSRRGYVLARRVA
jgi:SAM-dependent methyltransferase